MLCLGDSRRLRQVFDVWPRKPIAWIQDSHRIGYSQMARQSRKSRQYTIRRSVLGSAHLRRDQSGKTTSSDEAHRVITGQLTAARLVFRTTFRWRSLLFLRRGCIYFVVVKIEETRLRPDHLRLAPRPQMGSATAALPQRVLIPTWKSQRIHKMALARPAHLNRLFRYAASTGTSLSRQQARWQSYSSSDRRNDQRNSQPPPNISTEGERVTGSSDSPAPRSMDSAMVRQEGAEAAIIGHQPDFHAPIDHGTS